MISAAVFRELVSGRRRGVVATAARGLLRVLEWPTGWVVAARNRRFDRRAAQIHQVDVPVICVGNLTLGGTGKTPMVEWIARWIQQRDVSLAIVSRGYGQGAEGRNDEALELAEALPDVPHVQDADRVAAARRAVEEMAAELILLDDGFQHRRLARELDIVLLDATDPWGCEHLFPRGMLREPIASLARAHVVVLSRADMIEPTERRAIADRVEQFAPEALWCEVEHRADALVSSSGERQLLGSLSGKRVAAVCAIGNPAGFRHTLESQGCQLVAWREFADHHRYTPEDLRSLGDWAGAAREELVICTRKDLVKLRVETLADVPLLALDVQLSFLTGQEPFEAVLEATIDGRG